MFPTINHINDLLPYITGNPQFRVSDQPNGTTVVCYMLQDEDTFRGEHDAWYKECRGITFDTKTGVVLSRTLHKFQNVGENDETQPDQIPWNRIVRIMDKRDGSMITPVLLPDGSIVCKTKKTFTSAEAIEATKLLHADAEKLAWVRRCLESGFTPTFEWTSPRFPIVLLYEQDELTLLQVRDNVSGEYQLDPDHWEMRQGVLCPFPVIENLRSKFDDVRELLTLALTTEGVEGWIIQADDGQMWKVKTKWYCDLHHAVTFTRWRDIARAVLDDQSDDLKGAFALTGRDIKPILRVEREIKERIDAAKMIVARHVADGRALNFEPKDMALRLKDHSLFGQIMRIYRGGEVDWMEWYKKNHLKDDWDLQVVGHVSEDVEVPTGEE